VTFETTHRRIRFIVWSAEMPAGMKVAWIPIARLRERAVPAAALRVIEAARQARAESC
jgi:hypothetical protein